MVKRSLPHGGDAEGERLRWKGQRAPRKAVFMKVWDRGREKQHGLKGGRNGGPEVPRKS